MARSEGEPGARKGNFATYGLDAREGGGNHRRGDDNRKDRFRRIAPTIFRV